jgi:hypothetical protein
MRRIALLTLLLLVSGGRAAEAGERPASLRGSPASMTEQNRVAREHGLDFYRTAQEIHDAVARGELVRLEGNEDYALAHFVRLPYLRPELKLFIERISMQYRAACGQKLVVTSAVRPSTRQPRNAHRLSVHPAGMAVDLRVSDRASCRSWLESTLLSLERRGVLNGIREFNPPHYHVAVFPEPYLAYLEGRTDADTELARGSAGQIGAVPEAQEVPFFDTTPGAVSFLASADEFPESEPAPHSRLKAALVAVLALPFGLAWLLRRYRRG